MISIFPTPDKSTKVNIKDRDSLAFSGSLRADLWCMETKKKINTFVNMSCTLKLLFTLL